MTTELEAAVLHASGVEPRPMLRFVVKSIAVGPGGFRVFYGEHDVSELFEVKRLEFVVDADQKSRTRARLTVLAELDVEAETELHRLAKPRDVLALLRQVAKIVCGHELAGTYVDYCVACRARQLLAGEPVPACARCGLPENVHQGETTPVQDPHPFEPPA